MCLRCRDTQTQLKAVGEVVHGYATGHIWECVDIDGCDKAAQAKLVNPKTSSLNIGRLEVAARVGRLKSYQIHN